MLRISLSRAAASLAIVAFFLLQVAGVYPLPFLERLENQLYDARLQWTMPSMVDPRIVVVDIDEKSLKQEGRWPWGRDRLALLVDTLFDSYQITVLGFDVVFAEKDESSGLHILDRLAAEGLLYNKELLAGLDALRPSLERDHTFAASLKGRPVVLSYYFQPAGTNTHKPTGQLPPPVVDLFRRPAARRIPFAQAHGFGANLAILQDAALGAGFFDNPSVDPDGVYRRVPLVQSYQGRLYESFSLAVTRALLGSPPVELVTAVEGNEEAMAALEWLNVGGLSIPVDGQGAALVPYRGPQGSYPYVSAADVLSQKAESEVLRGAIVLVGTSAPGLQDLRSTPVQNVFPGVEIHANLIAGFLDQDVKHRPGYMTGVEFVELLLIGFFLSLLLPRLSAMWSLASTGAVVGLVVGGNFYAWRQANIVVPLASPLVLTASLFIVHMSYGFFVEGRIRRHLARLFGQYVPPELVEEMSRKPADFGLAGESREMTVLFSDIRNFTKISESLPPEEVTQLMNDFLTPMTRIVHKHRGTIDKYMGDAIMAFWGAPLQDPDHGSHALRAALEMIDELPAIQDRFSARRWPAIRIGIGLNAGMMNVGNMGSEFRMAYTVLGDAVNLGSRLEGLTKEYGVSIIVSEFVKEKAPGFVYRELDRVRVKGKDEPVTIFEPLGPEETLAEGMQEELSFYKAGLDFFRKQKWDEAETRFLALLKNAPQRLLYRVYLERIAHFRKTPPGSDWDGVFVYQTK